MYVDVKNEEERTVLVKPFASLQELPENSTNIEMDSVLKRYKRRPRNMECLTYADFATWYELCPLKKTPKSYGADLTPELPENIDNNENDDNIDQNISSDELKVIRFPCGTMIRKRTIQKVMYNFTTSINQDKEEHFCQKIMLYTHWRNDSIDILAGFQTYEDSFRSKEQELMQNSKTYESIPENMYSCLTLDDDCLPQIQPETEHQEIIDLEEGSSSVDFDCFNPGSCETSDVGEELGINRKNVGMIETMSFEVTYENYLEMVHLLIQNKRIFLLSYTAQC